ncbi:MAG: hypothetical protein QG583_584 [Patescibacteria group bacterium]|nr:hypothetical protein [Patescibacteria group bacterium]
MKIALGYSRIVIIYKGQAIKIARIYIIRTVLRVLTLPFVSNRSRNRYYLHFGKRFPMSMIRYVFVGLFANLREYKYSKRYKDERIAPVLNKYLGGLIITQPKGDVCVEADFELKNPFINKKRAVCSETYRFTQYCVFNNEVLLVDYGSMLTIKDLLRTKRT